MIRLIQGDFKNTRNYLMDLFKGDYFDFNFSYTSEHESLKEINRFVWESKHLKTRFKNRYSGPISICLSEWNNRCLNHYFDAFMYFLKDMSVQADICLYVEKTISREIFEKIKLFFPDISRIDLYLPEKKERKPKIGFCVSDTVRSEEKEYV